MDKKIQQVDNATVNNILSCIDQTTEKNEDRLTSYTWEESSNLNPEFLNYSSVAMYHTVLFCGRGVHFQYFYLNYVIAPIELCHAFMDFSLPP